jgi:hypothetical protein
VPRRRSPLLCCSAALRESQFRNERGSGAGAGSPLPRSLHSHTLPRFAGEGWQTWRTRTSPSPAKHREGALRARGPRREWDSNPRGVATRRFSRPVHSTALPSLQTASRRATGPIVPVDYTASRASCRLVVRRRAASCNPSRGIRAAAPPPAAASCEPLASLGADGARRAGQGVKVVVARTRPPWLRWVIRMRYSCPAASGDALTSSPAPNGTAP